ncbi:MAG: sulfotransferase family protein [Acidimicrobiia bacterium]
MAEPEIFPFFVGSGRSGTTLFQAIFSAHPELAICHESRFIVPFAGRRRRYERAGRIDLDVLVADLSRSSEFGRMGVQPELVRRRLRDEATTFAGAVRLIFALYAAEQGKQRYGDKTPGYISHLPLLAGLFPEARFVHVIRDGRDVALSYLEQRFGPRNVTEAAIYWRTRVRRGRAAGSRLGPEQYREVRYEALIAEPQATVAELCSFLELVPVEGMLEYFDDAPRLLAQTYDPEAHRSIALPLTRGLRDWRNQMSAEDVVAFEALAGDLIDELEYERGFSRIGFRNKIRAPLSRIRWQVRRAAALGKVGRQPV